jgi:hypothetical protein
VIENGSRAAINSACIAKPSYLFDSVGSIINDDRVDFRKISLSYQILKGWLHAQYPLRVLLLFFIISDSFRLRLGMLILDPFGDGLLAHHEAPTFFGCSEANEGAPLALDLVLYVHCYFIINTVMIQLVIIMILTWLIVF